MGKIGANKCIVQLIKVGYRIPFKIDPFSKVLRNNRSALNVNKFVKKKWKVCSEKGCVLNVSNIPKVVNPLTDAKKTKQEKTNRYGRPRLVLDCRHIHPHLYRFKYR